MGNQLSANQGSVPTIRNDEPLASEVPGVFQAAHDHTIDKAIFTDVRGKYEHAQNYYEAAKTGNGSSSLHRALKPEDMDETNRAPCLMNTRRNDIDDVLKWIEDDSNKAKKVLWVYGSAGTGKSTLSTTIAQIMRSRHCLGAFFFFNRDKPHRNSGTLIRTLAYQLALFDTLFCAAISQVVENNHNIAMMTLAFQFENLLSANALKSVEWPGGPIVLIIDALDECGSEVDRRTLMQVLSKGFSNLPSFIRIMIVSQPEPDIQRALRYHPHLRRYLLDTDSVANNDDVLEFIRHRLEEIRIKDGYLGEHWPGDDKIRSLADATDGLFIWASTACLYIDCFDPDGRLSELINKPPSTGLDTLYKMGLSTAPWNDSSFSSNCRHMLGVILCARAPLSHSVIDALLEFRLSRKILSYLRCVLDSTKGEIHILHASFYDYLISESCRHDPWSIDPQCHNKELTLHCIKLLNKELRENICDMTLPYLGRNIALPAAISYACKFWIEHACFVSDITDDIVNQIYAFLEKHLLHWMEAMAILESHDDTIQLIENLMKWLQKSSRSDMDLHQLLYDAHRFALHFKKTIKKHPLLIYTTAVPFTPTNTSIFKKFYHSGLPKVVCGVDKMWSPELMQLCHHSSVSSFSVVSSVALSPDGSKIISGSSDATIRVWDASTGSDMLPPLQGHDWITSVAFSPDGSKIISGSWDKTIQVWDASTGIEVLPPLRGHGDYINSVAVSPDGSKIISGSDDKTIRVWDASTGIEMLPPLRGHNHWINSVTFSPDGSKIISGSRDKTIRVWDANTGIEMLSPLQGHDEYVRSVAFSPNGSKIISGSHDKTIRVWDARTGIQMLPPLCGHDGTIVSVAFSPDGSKIISGSCDKTIRIWDASTGIEMLPPLRGHNHCVGFVTFSPDGSKIISGSEDKTIRVWDASAGIKMPSPLRGHDDLIHSIAFSPDGSKIISGSHDKTIQLWDASTGIEILPPLCGHGGIIVSVTFSPDGSRIISGSCDLTIRVWDARTGIEVLPPLQGHSRPITCVAFSPDGSKIISGSCDKTIQVWDANTGNRMLQPLQGHHDSILSVAFSPDGFKIISGSGDKTIRVWDARTGIEMLPPLQGHGDWISSVAFSPTGSKIISGSNDKTIRVWDASTGIELLTPLQGHDSGISSIAFSPNGSKIISWSTDAVIRVWDATTGIVLPHPPMAVNDDLNPRPAMDEWMRAWGWFTNLNTGSYMGALPVGASFNCGQVCGSTYVGWTAEHKLILVHFPEQ